MNADAIAPILNVSDFRANLAWFEALDWQTTCLWDGGAGESSFAGTRSGAAQTFLCREGQGSRGIRPPQRPFDEATGGVWTSWFLVALEDVDRMRLRAVESSLD